MAEINPGIITGSATILGVIIGYLLTSRITKKQNEREDRRWRRDRRDFALVECLKLCQEFRVRADMPSRAFDEYILNYDQLPNILLSLEPWVMLLVRHSEEKPTEMIELKQEIGMLIERYRKEPLPGRSDSVSRDESITFVNHILHLLENFMEKDEEWTRTLGEKLKKRSQSFWNGIVLPIADHVLAKIRNLLKP